MKKIILGGIAAIIVLVAGVGLYFQREIDRAAFAATLFSGAEQYENFNRLAELYPVSTMTAAETPFDFPNARRRRCRHPLPIRARRSTQKPSLRKQTPALSW